MMFCLKSKWGLQQKQKSYIMNIWNIIMEIEWHIGNQTWQGSTDKNNNKSQIKETKTMQKMASESDFQQVWRGKRNMTQHIPY
jgi:hypothetical protein